MLCPAPQQRTIAECPAGLPRLIEGVAGLVLSGLPAGQLLKKAGPVDRLLHDLVMHPNAQLIQNFYTAFQKLEPGPMAEAYHDEAVFSDPVFQNLPAWKARAMWAMLCERAQDFSLEFRDVEADDQTGRAYWEPTYTFSKTGNIIVNKIHASFEFKDGKIIKHVDRFSLWRWTRLALGTTGLIMGWTPTVQNKVRKEALTGLEMYCKRKRIKAPGS